MISQKAQISLEYILIALTILSVLSMLSYQIITIYNKNIETIDNKKLKNLYTQLQENLDFSENMPEYYKSITIDTEKEWEIYKSGKEIIIINKFKKYSINTNQDIKIIKTKMFDKNKIIIKKTNDIITITFEDKK
ncbi:MAG: hypothetical protein PHR26_00800 [Candidatus ainarchaeum sp.]|nr:hypothetical protein [Candidatus ainarchaeum sp.]MDD3976227.1 hypothetical protein [Candidatus ainarchaeum sp.]